MYENCLLLHIAFSMGKPIQKPSLIVAGIVANDHSLPLTLVVVTELPNVVAVSLQQQEYASSAFPVIFWRISFEHSLV
jgi:hypothetical protein